MTAWNSVQTDQQRGVQSEVQEYTGWNGDSIHAYIAKPLGDVKRGGVVLIHHMPGWDEYYREVAHRLAFHGYDVIAPDTYCREGHGLAEDVAAKVRAEGGPNDEIVAGDMAAAADWLRALPTNNGKVAVMGSCSGGRFAVLSASLHPDKFDAIVDLWGGQVVGTEGGPTERRPVPPVEYTDRINAPMLGLFGNDDQRPTPEEVDIQEAEMKKHGKEYEFYRYDGAGHGFFYYDKALFRFQQALDGWEKVFAFLEKHLRA